MKQLTVGSLFAGIGGIDLGLERAGMRTVWFSEIDPYASRVLAKHWPGVPNHGDITQIDFSTVEPVDVLAGGFPCTDVSWANPEGKGLDGERSGLWREYARAIREVRPRYVLVENVTALLVRGMGEVLGELSALGYDAWWQGFPAAYVGAPHDRDRVFIVAHPHHEPGLQTNPPVGTFGGEWLARHDAGRGHWGSPPPFDWAVPASCSVAVADGVPDRVDALRAYGNAVVPQVAELIGGWIVEHARAPAHREAA